MNTRSIPPHLRENVFRSYEDLLRFAVSNWPNESSHAKPVDISFATFCAGVRNAINSALAFRWTTDIDLAKLQDMVDKKSFVVAANGDNTITFRAPGRRGRPRKSDSSVAPLDTSPNSPLAFGPVPARDMTGEQIRAFVTLLDAGLLQGPILVKGEVSAVAFMDAFPNVSITFDDSRNESVLL